MMPRSIGGALTALAVLSTTALAATPATASGPDDGLLAHYTFTEATGTAVPDVTGNGHDGTLVGPGAWTGGTLALPGGAENAAYVALPDDLLAGQPEATVSVEVKPGAAALSSPSFLWNIGGTSETGSWFASANGHLRTTITPSNWTGEQNAGWNNHNLTAGVWQNVTATFADNGDATSTMTLYVDGEQVAQNTAVTMSPADLARHTTNRIGGSAYPSDQGFAGEFAQARIYTRALDASEVRAVADADADATASAVAAALDLGDTSAVTGDLMLPTTATWSTSDPAVVTAGGAVTRPEEGEPARTATLTGTVTIRGVTQVREFEVTVLPLEPGETALPPGVDLVAHYPLNDAYRDSDSTRSHQLGGVVGATWAADHLDLTGGGYVANNSFTGFTLTGDSLTLGLDVNVASTAQGSEHSTLVTYGSDPTRTTLSFRPFWTDHSSAAVLTVDGDVVAVAETAQPIARGVWQHLAVVLDAGTGTLTVYQNGAVTAQATGLTVTAQDLGNGVFRLNRDATTYSNTPALYRDLKVYRTAVTADQALALARVGAESGWQAFVAGLALPAIVTGDLELPGTPLVTWSSSDPAIIAADGTVTRPAPGEPDAAVTITATLDRGGVSHSHPVQLTVAALIGDAQRADEDAAALTVPTELRTISTLPAAGPTHGSTVTWAAADGAPVSLLTEDGTTYADPDRPAYGHPAGAATLVASVTAGATTVTREFAVSVPALPRAVDDEAYAFSYFTADTVEGENIYFAASNGNNALSWRELNGGNWVITSEHGERGLRDPFLIRSVEGDTFYLIATDLSIGRNGDWGRAQTDGSQYLEIWESTDLVTWSEQRHVKVSPETAGMTWAPEAYYDDDLGEYVVFWASRLFTDDTRTTCLTTESGSGCYARMMYATTKDFVTFSEPRIWQDTGSARIDSTVLKDGDDYYRFTKDEGGQTGCIDIIAEKSSSLTEVTTTASLAAGTGWTSVATCIARNAGFGGAVEGPTVFRANPGDTSGHDYYLYLDNYGGSGYFPLGTDDLDSGSWTRVAGSLPASRHGTVLPVTQRQWAGLTGEPAATTTSTTTVELAEGAVTATVTAADGFEAGGPVTFSAGDWSSTVHLAPDGDRYTAAVALPSGLSGTVTATYHGTEEITGSAASTELPAGPGTDPEPSGVTVSWSHQAGATLRPGAEVGATVAGATPGDDLALELHSTPVRLAGSTADAGGAATLTGAVPGDTAAGAHQLVVLVDGAQVASLPVTVQTSADDPVDDPAAGQADRLALTGPVGLLLGLLAAALLAAGIAVVAARRRAGVGDV